MSGPDLADLLEPVSSADPTGKDLAYTPDFQDLLDAAGGQPERVMGDKVIPAVQPDWKQVIDLGRELLSRSKDIRTAILLCQALLHREGFPGLDTGIALVHGLLTQYWDSVHPRLDPDDNDDPTERMNALLNLSDRDALLAPVRTAPLVRSRTFGVVSLRDLELAKGESSEPVDADETPPDMATIDAAFLDCEIERLEETSAAVSNAVGHIKEIETLVTDRVGVSQAPDLDPIRDLLTSADVLLRAKVAKHPGTDGAASEPDADSGGPAQATPGAALPTTPAKHTGSEIASREDVVRTLDRLCDYYLRNEPSSPVPLLLQRARRLVTKDFMGIVQDLVPEALAHIEAIRGPEGDK